jgi:hypothetical protein
MVEAKQNRAGHVNKATVVDELGRIEADLAKAYAKLEKQVTRAAELRALILSWYDATPANEAALAEGKKFVVQVTACFNQRTLDIGRVYRKLGWKRFLLVCSVPLGKAQAVLGPREMAACVTTAQTGPRSLSVVARG